MTSSDLEKIRAEQNKLMPDTVYVQCLTRTSDNAGGFTEVWQTTATVKGRIVCSERQAGETVKGGEVKTYGEYIVTLPYNTNLRQDDRLQINGVQYEVIAILERSEKTALRVIVSKV